MIKTIIFELDDTLLWDKKSVATAFQLTCQKAAETYELNPSELEEAVRSEARALYATYDTYEFTQMIRNLDKYNTGVVNWRILATYIILLKSSLPTEKQCDGIVESLNKRGTKEDKVSIEAFITVSIIVIILIDTHLV